MKLRVLGCYGGIIPGYRLSGFLIDDTLLIEAGTIGEVLTVEEQLKINNILISHSHLDHFRALPFFIDIIFNREPKNISIYSINEVIESFKRNILNNEVWPDYTKFSNTNRLEIKLHALPPGIPTPVENFIVTAVPTIHTVPSTGFLIESGNSALVYTGDIGFADDLWKIIQSKYQKEQHAVKKSLKGIITEVSFPESMQEFADECSHLTIQTLQRELKKLNMPDIPIYLTHIKPSFVEEIQQDLKKYTHIPMQILEQDKEYFF